MAERPFKSRSTEVKPPLPRSLPAARRGRRIATNATPAADARREDAVVATKSDETDARRRAVRCESNLPPPPSGAVPPPGDPTDGEGRRGGATVRVRTVRDSPSPPSREGAEKSRWIDRSMDRSIERTRARAPPPVAPLRQRSPRSGPDPGGGGGGGARAFSAAVPRSWSPCNFAYACVTPLPGPPKGPVT